MSHIENKTKSSLRPSLLQTEAWEKLQKELGETTCFKKTSVYQYLAIQKHIPGGCYLYLPYGPYGKDKKGYDEALADVLKLAKSKSAIFIRFEAEDRESASKWLKMPNLKDSHDLNPADTWRLDLTQPEDAIVSGFSQGTRTRFHNYAKKGLSVETTKDPDDIKYLTALQHKLAREKGIATFSDEYLRTELKQDFATLYLVRYHKPVTAEKAADKDQPVSKKPMPKDGQIIAASLFFDDDTTRYYMQSAADGDFKHLPATVALLTSALFDAKKKGLKEFDFWGIAPDGAPDSHPWAGFTEFKKSFGGHEVHYAGTRDLVLNKTKYRAYQILRKVNRLKRRVLHQ